MGKNLLETDFRIGPNFLTNSSLHSIWLPWQWASRKRSLARESSANSSGVAQFGWDKTSPHRTPTLSRREGKGRWGESESVPENGKSKQTVNAIKQNTHFTLTTKKIFCSIRRKKVPTTAWSATPSPKSKIEFIGVFCSKIPLFAEILF